MGSASNEKSRQSSPDIFADIRSENIEHRWDGLIREAESAQYLRGLFNLFSVSVKHPEIHNLLFERIHYLKNQESSQGELIALESLQEEIEAIVYREYSDEAPWWLRNYFSYGGMDGLQ